MIADLKPYPTYKDSGVPWLGMVPKYWRTCKLKYIASLHGRIGFHGLSSGDYRDHGIILVGGVNFKGWAVDWSSCHRIDEAWYLKDPYIQLREGDLLITKDGTIGKTAIVTHVPERAVLNSGVMVIRPKGDKVFMARYVTYCLNSQLFSEFITLKRTGATIHHLYEATFYNFPVLLPSMQEQAAIVRFLDHADRKIRRYIRAKQKLIKLLEEQKQVIIHRAVTRGLDANVRLKPSGVEWLGDIPEHWEVVPLRWYISIGSGYFIESHHVWGEADTDTGIIYPVIGGNGVMGYSTKYNTQSKSIVVGRVGALCGNVHLVDRTAWITDNALRINNIREFAPAYLATQLRAMNLHRLANASAQPLVTGGMIKTQRVAKPPLEEQEKLAGSLVNISTPMESAVAKTRNEISLLREFRTRLFADVVTGKLDVREAAARLPEETDEPEPEREFEEITDAEAADELADLETEDATI